MWPINQWEFQDPKMEVLHHIRPYFAGIFPYIGLIYGRYLQFRILKFPLNQGIVFYASPPAPASFRKSNFRRWPPLGPERCVILEPSGRWAAMCQLLSKKICTSRKCSSIPKTDAEDGFHMSCVFLCCLGPYTPVLPTPLSTQCLRGHSGSLSGSSL